MDVHVRGGPAHPFLGARDLFETEHDLDRPVSVDVRDDPTERTRVSHDDESHLLTISRAAATSAMARELALHEFAHMARYEQAHPSHVQSTEEAIFLALSGTSVERRTVAHCYQIANHAKDIYADDVWLQLAPADKLVSFLESSLAAAVADRPSAYDDSAVNGGANSGGANGGGAAGPAAWHRVASESPRIRRPEKPASRLTPAADPEITAVNAAFALAICERHDLVDRGHRLYDLARVAAADAPAVDVAAFRRRFRSLAHDTDESEYRKDLVDLTRAYADASASGGSPDAAAD